MEGSKTKKLFDIGVIFVGVGAAFLGAHTERKEILEIFYMPSVAFDWVLYIGLGTFVLGLLLMIVPAPLEYIRERFSRANELLFELALGCGGFVCRPVSFEELAGVREFCVKALKSDEFTSLQKMQQWYRKNSQLMWVVEEKLGEKTKIVGYFSFLPLTKSAVDGVRREELNGVHFTTDHILSHSRVGKNPYSLYLGGVVGSGLRGKAATLQCLGKYMEAEMKKGATRVFTRPTTDAGLRWVKKAHFEAIDPTIQWQMFRIYESSLDNLLRNLGPSVDMKFN